MKNVAARIYLTAFFLMSTILTFGQEEGGTGEGGGEVDINVDLGGEDTVWYGQWWIWAVGIALFIIVLVAIVSLSRGGRSERE